MVWNDGAKISSQSTNDSTVMSRDVYFNVALKYINIYIYAHLCIYIYNTVLFMFKIYPFVVLLIILVYLHSCKAIIMWLQLSVDLWNVVMFTISP